MDSVYQDVGEFFRQFVDAAMPTLFYSSVEVTYSIDILLIPPSNNPIECVFSNVFGRFLELILRHEFTVDYDNVVWYLKRISVTVCRIPQSFWVELQPRYRPWKRLDHVLFHRPRHISPHRDRVLEVLVFCVSAFCVKTKQDLEFALINYQIF